MKKSVTLLIVLAMAGAAPVASATPFSDAVNALSPVGYWQFEGNYNDSTANGNNLTTFGTVGITSGPGLPGLGASALDLRHLGGQQGLYVATGEGNALRLSGTQYSINAWVSNEEVGPWGMMAVERNTDWIDGWNYGLSQYRVSSTTGMRGWNPGLPQQDGISGSDSAWHMLTVSVDLTAATATFYVDGVSVGSVGTGGASLSGTGTLFVVGNNETPLGAAQWGADLNGRMDELAVFGTALSAGQIATLYAAASATPATLTGQVHLEGFGGVPQDVRVQVELRQGANVDLRRVTLDNSWGFSFSSLIAGTYTITIKTPGWRPTILVDKPVSGTTTLDPVTLSAGDFDTDGEVTSTDLSLLLGNME